MFKKIESKEEQLIECISIQDFCPTNRQTSEYSEIEIMFVDHLDSQIKESTIQRENRRKRDVGRLNTAFLDAVKDKDVEESDR